MKSGNFDCKVFDDFLSPKELAFLQKQMKASFLDHNTLHYRYPESNKDRSDVMSLPSGSVESETKEFLRSKLGEIVPAEARLDFTFHKNFTPYWLHTDAGYEEGETPLKQGIIPLEVQPSDKKVYTVILNQRLKGSSGVGLNTQGIENLVKDGLSKAEVAEFWDPNPEAVELLSKFSINTPFLWRLGSTAIWNRSMIHGSSRFDTAGVDYKVGLMWISTLPKE